MALEAVGGTQGKGQSSMRFAVRAVPLVMLMGLVPGTAGADPGIRADEANAVPACATPGRLMAFLRHRNPELDPRFNAIAVHYMREGNSLGLRWDYAFFQMIVETGALTFRRGDGRPGAVSPRQNNFAGLGAVGGREPGESFPDLATGVRAHLQHVVLYTGAPVANPVAERTRKVQEWGIIARWQRTLGRATTFPDLAVKWAPDTRGYWPSIEAVARRFRDGFCGQPDPEPLLAGQAPQQRVGAGAPQNDVGRAARDRCSSVRLLRRRRRARRLGVGVPKALPRSQDAAPEPPRAAVPPRQHTAAVVPAKPHVPRHTAPAAVHPPATAPAAPRQLSAAEQADERLRQLVSGRTVNLDTPIGTVIPIVYGPDGRLSGKAGGLAGYLGAASDEGEWWVEKGRLCQRWKIWFKGTPDCLKFRQSGQVIYWESDNGKSGTARIVGN